MAEPSLNHLTIATIMEKWPQTIEVFQRFKTACIGCEMASFATPLDVVHYYDLDETEFLAALRSATAPDTVDVAE